MTHPRRFFMVASLAVASLALPACTKMIDTAAVEKNVSEELEKQLKVKVKSVVCPKEVTEKEGGTFECTATDDGGNKAIIEVTMSGGGNIKWATKHDDKAKPAEAKPAGEKPAEEKPAAE
jgi:hypothetical protein